MARSPALASATILLVEDHSALLKLVKQILEEAHFVVLPARNAREAIRLDADFKGNIDLLLSDVRMRGMPGPELAVKIRQHRPEIAVVLMSGYPVTASLAHHPGCHYIQKPFGPGALVERIRLALRGEARSASGSLTASDE